MEKLCTSTSRQSSTFLYKKIYEESKDLAPHFLKTSFTKLTKRIIEFLKNPDQLIPEKYWPPGQRISSLEHAADKNLEEELSILNVAVHQIFDQKSGALFIKLNGISPKVLNSLVPEMRFEDFHQILLALKDCDVISSYLQDCENDEDIYLVSKKWQSLLGYKEFRLYIINGILVGIVQRKSSICYDALAKDLKFLTSAADKIKMFFNEVLSKCLSKTNQYVVDVYFETKTTEKIWIIDIEYMNEKSGKLFYLISYQELIEALCNPSELPVIKIVRNESECIRELFSNQVPADFLDEETGVQNIEHLMELIKKQNEFEQNYLKQKLNV